MAIIQIPVGGQAVGVEVPDFAMDVTLRELVNEVRQQTTSVAAGLSTLTSTTANAGNRQEATLLNSLNRVGQFIQNNVPGGRQAVQTVSAVAETTNVLAESNKLSTALKDGLLSNLPIVGSRLSVFGEALAAPVSIIEGMSQALKNFVQVGGSASMSMIEMKNSAATIGLELSEFSVLVGESGKTVAALGGNTTEGTKRLIELVSTLRSATQDLAFLGMSSSEMAQYMVDEMEARRRLSNTIDLQAMDSQQLSAALKERYINESAIARLTGQDVRDRMKAQMDYQMSVSGAGVLASLQNQQQRAATEAFIGGTTQFGENQQLVQEMFNRQMMFGSAFAGLSEELTSQAAIMMGLGIDLQSFVAQQADAARAGNVDMVQAMTNQFASEIKMMAGTSNQQVLTGLSMLGVQGAEAGAEMILGTITANSNAIGSYTEQVIAQRQRIMDDMETGLYQMQALQSTYEQVQANAIALKENFTLQAFGVNAATESTAGSAIVAGLTAANSGIQTANLALETVGQAQIALTDQIRDTLGIEGSVTNMFASMTTMIDGLNTTMAGYQAIIQGYLVENRNN